MPMKMSTITPNEFLQFAKELGLEREPSPPTLVRTESAALTGLAVLNNLCHLIEHLHTLKAENDRLRAHLELVKHVETFLSRSREAEEKDVGLSPSNSWKLKKFQSNTLSVLGKERQGRSFEALVSRHRIESTDDADHHEESSSMLHIDHEHSEFMDSNLGLSNWNHWNKVRDALKFSLRRKKPASASPVLTHADRPIPAISISLESDDDHPQENKRPTRAKQRKKLLVRSDDHRHAVLTGGETDQDDESLEFTGAGRKRNNERHEASGHPASVDDDSVLSRKQSKIAHYGRKLRSKLDTVKRQFSDQLPLSSPSLRLLTASHGSTLDEMGPGLNHALLSVKLAPAMTKSYQEKMRQWQTLQKSQFLVQYRRQSITNQLDFSSTPRKMSTHSAEQEASSTAILSSSSVVVDDVSPTNLIPLSPILSPNQRSLIVHQWREIMSEEIFLRHYDAYLQRQLLAVKQLESHLKSLKANIFSTQHRSMTSLDQHRHAALPQRCRSLQSLVAMPASWILAVQSAAYSDVLDGTSYKTSERALVFNKPFFDQLKHFRDDRKDFEDNLLQDRPIRSNVLPADRARPTLNRACLRKLSFRSSHTVQEGKNEPFSRLDLLSTPTNSEHDPTGLLPSASNTTLNRRTKRTRFDLKKSFQRSKSICMTQFHFWLQRRRQQQQQQESAEPRRKSAVETKTAKDSRTSPCSTPKLLGSPRLARLHRRIFHRCPSPSSLATSPSELPPLPSSFAEPSLSSGAPLDDSDDRFLHRRECPVRIYFPARTPPSTRHVRIADLDLSALQKLPTPPMSRIASPVVIRRTVSPAMKLFTAQERRESFATMSNNLVNRSID